MILTNLQAAIAAKAGRERALAVLLVAVWGRLARMRTRLERLIALWRAGKLPTPRMSRARAVRAPRTAPRMRFPTGAAWLALMVREAVPFGTQIEHYLSDAEARAFLAAVPQAGRIFRPLLHMLGVGVVAPRVQRKRPVWHVVAQVAPAGLVVGPDGRLAYV